MNIDFHYYATYCAACLAGYTPEESGEICYAASLVDHCSTAFLAAVEGPAGAATVQQAMEMAQLTGSPLGRQAITRTWGSFHFLPGDLNAEVGKGTKRYKDKYRLICNANSKLLPDTIEGAKHAGTLQAVGLVMHVLADSWAHRYFAGTASLVINNTNYYFYELLPEEMGGGERQITFKRNPLTPDDPENACYVNCVYQGSENSVMNLCHGRAGHLPDYSFLRYKYLPAWADYEAVVKDNPSDFLHAFAQMITAMKYIRGDLPSFETEQYDWEAVAPWREKIEAILLKRQLWAADDWKQLALEISGQAPEEFVPESCQKEYRDASPEEKDHTVLGKFIMAALYQKSMVTNRVYLSGNKLMGRSLDYHRFGLRGNRDFFKLADRHKFAEMQKRFQKQKRGEDS